MSVARHRIDIARGTRVEQARVKHGLEHAVDSLVHRVAVLLVRRDAQRLHRVGRQTVATHKDLGLALRVDTTCIRYSPSITNRTRLT